MDIEFPFVAQSRRKDCGPACIAMIGRYFGKWYSLEQLSGMIGMTAAGVTLLGLSGAAEAIGFRTLAVETSLEAVEAENLLPFIAHWSKQHYVVVYKVSPDAVWIADPARDLLVLSRDEFLEQWGTGKEGKAGRGIALLLQPTPRFYAIIDKTGEEP